MFIKTNNYYFSFAILFSCSNSSILVPRNRSLIFLNCSSSLPSVIESVVASKLSSFLLPRARGTIDELNEQNSVIFRRNERRPIRAWKAKRQEERERTDTSTNRLNDGETRGCYSRHLHLYGVSL